jgi:hypothetical protein
MSTSPAEPGYRVSAEKDERALDQMTSSKPAAADNSRKSILARGCDPHLSASAARALPPLMGNPSYVPTTDDEAFVEQLRSRSWSVVYFAPGACRYSAANQPIPGGNSETSGWTLAEYRELVHQHQGEEVQIVETPRESEALDLLRDALAVARETD